MLVSYIQNASVKMTKEAYFEMCEALGTAPLSEEIPVEIDDFPLEVQEILEIYNFLKDDWDAINGVYHGKELANIIDVFDIYEVPREDRRIYLTVLHIIDAVRKAEIKKQTPTEK